MSLIKSGRHPDPRGDEGQHRFAYAMLPHQGGFGVESIVRPAFEFNVNPTVRPASANPSSFSLLSVDQPNVIVAAVKKAEDDDDLIVRLYEAGKAAGYVRVKFNIPIESVSEVNLLEESPEPIAQEFGEVELFFKPFEIKTLKVKLS